MWTSIKPILAAAAADESRFENVTILGVDQHVWHHVSTKPVEHGGRGPKELTGMVDLTRDEHAHVRAGLLDLVPGRSGETYGESYHAADGPLRSRLIDIEWMLDEPFYQLMRQQLLAWRLERDGAEGGNAVRVLHLLPPHTARTSPWSGPSTANSATRSIESGPGCYAAQTASTTSTRQCSATKPSQVGTTSTATHPCPLIIREA